MLSYWEACSLLQYDAIIIGSGIVGLHTAIELKERYPDREILVLERSLLPFGASTRNAGFACMGSFTELLDDLQHLDEAGMTALFLKRKAGLELLRKRLGDAAIGYRENGSYELITPSELPLLDKLTQINRLLHDATGREPFRRADERIADFGFNAEQIGAIIENTMEGELHTGQMMRSLIRFALKLGIEIKTGAVAVTFHETEKEVTVTVTDAVRGETIALQCGQLFICTNAFTRQLLPGADLQPGRGQVLITSPVEGLPFKGIFHFDKGYYYFREIDGRVLLGGGRNLDFEKETTTSPDLNEALQAHLESLLRTLILPGRSFTIERRWAGIMAFGNTKQPIVSSFGQRVYGAFRMGGMGVALGAATAKDLVDLFQGDPARNEQKNTV